MKKRHNGGFSLVEVLVAIVILAIIVVPACSSMVLSARMNAKSEAILQARLAVSSTLETLMAEGITGASGTYDVVGDNDRFPGVTVMTAKVSEEDAYYTVKVFDGLTEEQSLVSITTKIRAVPSNNNGEGGTS